MVKFKKPARALGVLRVAHEKLNVEMADRQRVQLAQVGVAFGEPVAVFLKADFWEMPGITLAVFGVSEAPVVRAVKTNLRQLRPGFTHKIQIFRLRVIRPMSDHGGKLQRPLRRTMHVGASASQKRK